MNSLRRFLARLGITQAPASSASGFVLTGKPEVDEGVLPPGTFPHRLQIRAMGIPQAPGSGNPQKCAPLTSRLRSVRNGDREK